MEENNKKLYKITIAFEGKIMVLIKKIVKETDKTFKCENNTYYKSEFDKIVDHNCTMIGQKAIYTIDKNKIGGYVKEIKEYYDSVYIDEKEKLENKIKMLNEEIVIKEE